MTIKQWIVAALCDFVERHQPGDPISPTCRGLCSFVSEFVWSRSHSISSSRDAASEFYGILLSDYQDQFGEGAYLDTRYFATEKRIRIAKEVIALLEKRIADEGKQVHA